MWQAALRKTPNDPYAQKQVADLTAQLAAAERGLSSNYVVFDENLLKILSRE